LTDRAFAPVSPGSPKIKIFKTDQGAKAFLWLKMIPGLMYPRESLPQWLKPNIFVLYRRRGITATLESL
jgi:hypothetical protein